MKVDKSTMLLYVVTDRSWLGNQLFEHQIEEILKARATFLQLREKELDQENFLQEAKRIKVITDQYRVPFVINDNIKVALAANADGIHIGQEDLSIKEVRAKLGADKIIGVSAQTVEQAILAQKQGADYIGVGAVFSTSTKQDARDVSYETLKDICQAVRIPVVAIGGINEGNIMKLKGSKVDGVAVISAIFAKPEVGKATAELLELSRKMVEEQSN